MTLNDQPFLAELTEDQIFIKNTIREFAENKIKPVIMEYDEEYENFKLYYDYDLENKNPRYSPKELC